MSELSERARKLADTIDDKCIEWSYGDTIFLHSKAKEAIEQALLAERRLAMEEAAKIASAVREEEEILSNKLAHENHLTKAREAWCWSRGAITVMQALRTAAEKEVKNG